MDAGRFACKANRGDGYPEIVVIGQNTCPACRSLKGSLDSKNIPYSYRDLSVDREGYEVLEEKGIHYIPVTIVGPYLVSGNKIDNIEICIEACKNL